MYILYIHVYTLYPFVYTVYACISMDISASHSHDKHLGGAAAHRLLRLLEAMAPLTTSHLWRWAATVNVRAQEAIEVLAVCLYHPLTASYLWR